MVSYNYDGNDEETYKPQKLPEPSKTHQQFISPLTYQKVDKTSRAGVLNPIKPPPY